MDEVQTHYTIEILMTSPLGVTGSSLIEYRGENVGYDWWNYSPIKFKSEEEAVCAINQNEDYRSFDWMVTKPQLYTK